LDDRESILSGCFELDLSNEVKDLKGKRVLVLDDIVTTGSTVKELRRLLLEEGAAAVDCLCLAH
jgi:predicted amidophosphoribosyltransferase